LGISKGDRHEENPGPDFFGKSCASCVAVVYLVLLGLIFWLIFDAELPLIAMKWHW